MKQASGGSVILRNLAVNRCSPAGRVKPLRQLSERLPRDQRLTPGAVQHEARLAIPIPERQSDDAVDGQTEESAGAGDHSMARRKLPKKAVMLGGEPDLPR